MSTKTTIKRIALVAAAALTIGGFSAVSANAVGTACTGTAPYGQANLYGYNGYDMANGVSVTSTTDAYQACDLNGANGSQTVTGIAGAFNNVTVRVVAPNVAATDYVITVSSGVILSGGTIATGGASTVVAANTTTDIVISTPVIGTQTVSYWVRTNGLLASSAAKTVTINVIAAPVGSVYATSTIAQQVYGSASASTYANVDTDGKVSYLGNSTDTTAIAQFTVNQIDGNKAPMAASATKAVSASVSGVGSLSIGAGVTAAVAPYVYAAAGTSVAPVANGQVIRFYADGRAGKATVTISVNGVAVKSFDITVYGSAAKYVPTVNHNYLAVGQTYGAGNEAVSFTAVDANGVASPGSVIKISSSATTIATIASGASVATVSACGATAAPAAIAGTPLANNCTSAEWALLGTTDVQVAAVAKGKFTVNAANATTSPTITATAASMVTGAQAATVTLTTDASSYSVGGVGTLSLTLKDSDGNPVGDWAYNVINTTITSNVAVLGTTANAATTIVGIVDNVTTVDGVATAKFFAPNNTGELTFSGKLDTISGDLAAALRGTTVSTTSSVTSEAVDAAALAQDAANAATDAANNAYDEAQNATQAASDALAAVTALAAQVKSLIASVKKLTAAVAKLKK